MQTVTETSSTPPTPESRPLRGGPSSPTDQLLLRQPCLPQVSYLPCRLYSMERCSPYALLWDSLNVALLKPWSLAAD